MRPSLTEFLFARIAEDEEIARDAIRHAQRNYGTGDSVDQGPPWMCDEQTEHVALAPARVIAECDAKLKLIGHLSTLAQNGVGDRFNRGDEALVCALRVLASVYSDHRDYREEWWA